MTNRILSMSETELTRLEVMQRIEDKRLTQVKAAHILGISSRQVRNLLTQYRLHGANGLISKRRGQQSNNRISDAVRAAVIECIETNYHDFGPTLAHEKLTEQHGFSFSVEFLRQRMIEAGIWNGKARKAARTHQMRERRACFGELVQIDGSPHHWFEERGPSCCLIVFIDDATGRLVALHFVEDECTEGYFQCVRQHLAAYGKPIAYYSDRHGIFRVNIKQAKSGNGETQLSRAMRELDIELINATTPQAKGRVERVNGTLQDRLVKELRLERISDIQAANAFLPGFIADFNERFARTPANSTDAHRQTVPADDQLNQILSQRSVRTITKNLEVHYNNKIYQIQSKSPCYTMRRSKIEVCDLNGAITLLYKGKSQTYKIFEKDNKPTPIADAKQINVRIDKKVIQRPKLDHPWRTLNRETKRNITIPSEYQNRKSLLGGKAEISTLG
jgi:hypothetical protein